MSLNEVLLRGLADIQCNVPLANSLDISVIVDDLLARWSEPHRKWHGLNHLESVLRYIDWERAQGRISLEEYRILFLAAIYHDAVYYPRAFDNEEKSAALFSQFFEITTTTPFTRSVHDLILATKQSYPGPTLVEKVMFEADWDVLLRGSFNDLMVYESGIFYEYQFVAYTEYLKRRLAFLDIADHLCVHNSSNIRRLISYLESRRLRIGVYAGSFNPFTIGHLDIATKAAKMFDKVIIVKAINPEKSDITTVNIPDWATRIPYEVVAWSGLITDYLDQVEQYADVVYVRGLRNSFDLVYEFNQLQFLKELKPNINHTMVFCDATLQHISSTDVRALLKLDKKKAQKFLV